MRGARPRPQLSEGKKAERKLGWLLCAPAALVMVAVTAYPILYSVWLSLQRFDLKFPDQREFIGLANYVTVLTNEYWWTAFGVTALITVVTVAVELVLGMGLAIDHAPDAGRPRAGPHGGADPVRHRHGGRRVLLAVRVDAGHRLPGQRCSATARR